jgi:hypothetical protein
MVGRFDRVSSSQAPGVRRDARLLQAEDADEPDQQDEREKRGGSDDVGVTRNTRHDAPRKNYADREESVGLGCPAGENIQCVRRIAGSVSSLGDEAAHVYEPNDLGVQSSRADCERLSRWSQASFHPLRTGETREQT